MFINPRHWCRFVWKPFVFLILATTLGWSESSSVIKVKAYGLIGDGITDDGIGLQKLLNATENKISTVIEFEPNKIYRLKTGTNGYVFNLKGKENLTINGNHSIFLIDPSLRSINIQNASKVNVRNMKIDYDPLPFSQGRIVKSSSLKRFIDVEIDPGFAIPPQMEQVFRTPTDSQPFFGILWGGSDENRTTKGHLHIDRMIPMEDLSKGERTAGRQMRIFVNRNFGHYEDIVEGQTLIDLPISQIAHLVGLGENCRVEYSSDIQLEGIDLWSAPWFAYVIRYNRGDLIFKNVNVIPKPGTSRRMSSWRDGFHLKGNSGKILFEKCTLIGMHDDAFNISTHFSKITKILSDQEIVVSQNFKIQYVPWNSNGEIEVADFATQSWVGSSPILSKQEVGLSPDWTLYSRETPEVTLKLKNSIPGMKVGQYVWDATAANPSVVIDGVYADNSSRFRCPHMKIKNSTFKAFVWFMTDSDHIEGSFPHDIQISDSRFIQGRGNKSIAVAVNGAPFRAISQEEEKNRIRLVKNFKIERTQFDGDISVIGVDDFVFKDCSFIRKDSIYTVQGSRNVSEQDCKFEESI